MIVFIAKDTPIDQYFVNHPEFITSQPVEKAWLNADNPYILLQHLPCAAHEYPLRQSEPSFPHQTYAAAIRCTQSLLTSLLEGNIFVPQITMTKFSLPPLDHPPPEDEEAITLNLRLNRASKIMKQKRERLH